MRKDPVRHDYFGYGSLSKADFERLSSFIYTYFGIYLPPKKQYLLQTRLVKRLRALGMTSYSEYANFVLKNGLNGDEAFEMIDVVSTNKTDFFRDKAHFDFVSENINAEWKNKRIKVWSAGCSSGQELYSLAMILQLAKSKGEIVDFEGYGSDISAGVLEKASKAIYPYREAAHIPDLYRKKFLLRSKQSDKPQIRIVPELRSKVSFLRINLIADTYPLVRDFQFIFCRNTLIYFDRETQRRVVQNLSRHLAPGGYFFIGFSESLIDMDIQAMGLQLIKPTIYRKNQTS